MHKDVLRLRLAGPVNLPVKNGKFTVNLRKNKIEGVKNVKNDFSLQTTHSIFQNGLFVLCDDLHPNNQNFRTMGHFTNCFRCWWILQSASKLLWYSRWGVSEWVTLSEWMRQVRSVPWSQTQQATTVTISQPGQPYSHSQLSYPHAKTSYP